MMEKCLVSEAREKCECGWCRTKQMMRMRISFIVYGIVIGILAKDYIINSILKLFNS